MTLREFEEVAEQLTLVEVPDLLDDGENPEDVLAHLVSAKARIEDAIRSVMEQTGGPVQLKLVF